jgi:hypothetical protein
MRQAVVINPSTRNKRQKTRDSKEETRKEKQNMGKTDANKETKTGTKKPINKQAQETRGKRYQNQNKRSENKQQQQTLETSQQWRCLTCTCVSRLILMSRLARCTAGESIFLTFPCAPDGRPSSPPLFPFPFFLAFELFVFDSRFPLDFGVDALDARVIFAAKRNHKALMRCIFPQTPLEDLTSISNMFLS